MPLNVLFMGTPAFAVPALQALIDSPHRVLAVYSQPPRPAQRGQQLTKSPIHLLAEQHAIPVETPVTLKNAAAQARFAGYDADVAVVAAYGLLLPQAVLDAPRHGCVNIHPSALPRWRGAAPIQHTILAGDAMTEMCIMQMDKGLDTGAVMRRVPYAITNGMTTGALHDHMAQLGAQTVLDVLNDIEAGTAIALPQAEEGTTYAAKIDKAMARIDWRKPATNIDRLVRGMNPFPAAWFDWQGEAIKLFGVEIVDGSAAPGTVLDDKLTIACGNAAVRLTELQRPGKKRLPAAELLRGFTIPAGSVLN